MIIARAVAIPAVSGTERAFFDARHLSMADFDVDFNDSEKKEEEKRKNNEKENKTKQNKTKEKKRKEKKRKEKKKQNAHIQRNQNIF